MNTENMSHGLTSIIGFKEVKKKKQKQVKEE